MEQRRLAFTDIVGYSRMVQTDEGLALELLEDHDWIVGERIDGKGGGTLKTAGDSFLASFEPAGAALAAAAAIQQALAVRNEGLPEERQLHIRIGIHAADVVFTDEHEGFLYHGLCQQYLVAPEAQSAGAGAATSHCTRYGRREL